MATLDRWRSFLETPKTIELVHAELLGRHDALLVGEGEIRMETLQEFSYSMKPKSGEPFAFLRALEQFRQNPYDGTARLRLVGRDPRGVEWSAGFTVPQKINLGGEWLIEGRLSGLITDERFAPPLDSTELVFHTDHLHPLARVMSSSLKEPEKRLEILGSVIEFKYERTTNVVSITASHSHQLRPTYTEAWLIQPLRIMFGQPVYPRLFARNKGSEAMITIAAPPRLDIVSWCSFWLDDSSTRQNSFFDCYSQLLTMIALAGDHEPHPVTRYYDEMARVTMASRWVRALTLAGCTEGLAKLLRPKMTVGETEQDEQSAREVDDLAEKIERLVGREDLKKRARDAILQTKGASTPRTLRALLTSGIITDDQFKAYSSVRNKVMHGELVSPYSNEDEDIQVSHLVGLVRSLTQGLVKRS